MHDRRSARVRLPTKTTDARHDRSRQVRAQQSDWLERAARLPGKAMHLGFVLQHLASVQQVRRVSLDNVSCLRFGITRNAKYRALACLEKAGLVTSARKLGRSPSVTILQGD